MKKETDLSSLKKHPIRTSVRQTSLLLLCFARLFRVALVLAGTPFLLGLLGRFIGKSLNIKSPYFLVLFLVFGFFLGGYYAFVELRKMLAES